MRDNFNKALQNIIHHGDTDIFPFPFERHLFEDKLEESLNILEEINSDLDKAIGTFPPLTLVSLSQVGYYGFRRATLIEPFWNAYYLGLVISIADKIESNRIPSNEDKVFSYRYEWNDETHSLFKDSTWIDYKRKCVELSNSYKFVLQTDIANFYDRVNHHRLENALKRIDNSNTCKGVMKLLSAFSNTISYGLPVGGPASRILAELALNQSDQNLKTRGTVFCRYADDYTIFCDSETECYNALILLTEKLAIDQLALQKGKTKIMSTEEFRDINRFLDPQPTNTEDSDDEQKLLNISIRFDPYSATADEDYERLKEAVHEIDLIGILSKEVHKTAIDPIVTKQAINAIKVVDQDKQAAAVSILLDSNNLTTLSPVFTTIMRLIRSIYGDLSDDTRSLIDQSLLHLFTDDSYLTKINLNLYYIVQVLAFRHSQAKTELFIKLYETAPNGFLKRQIIVALANWECDYLLSDIKNHYPTMTKWERRSFIYASYFLGDEGRHWREHNKSNFSTEEVLVRDWCSERRQQHKSILV